MVVARTPDAYHALVDQLSRHQVERNYRVLVLGTVDGTTGVVDAPIGRSVSSPTRMAVTRKGKEARTRYHVDQRFTEPAPTTLMTATLETGRTHQIRVHLTAIGHPVVGDEVYSQGRSLPGATLSRPFLHAFRLSLDHPRTGQPLSWTSELPEDLRRPAGRPGRLRAIGGPPLRRPVRTTGERDSGGLVGGFEHLAVAQELQRLRLGLADLADADAQPLGRGLERRRVGCRRSRTGAG